MVQSTTNYTVGDLYSNDSWGLGSSSSITRALQFPQTADKLPSSDEVWGDYYDGVMRGNADGYDGSTLPLNVLGGETGSEPFSRTYSENDPTNLSDVEWSAGGDPSTPYTPSCTSPGAGPAGSGAFDWEAMPQGPTFGYDSSVIAGPDVNPWSASSVQQAQGGGSSSPSYELGKWSDA